MANWDKITSSGDVEDRRGNPGSTITGFGAVGSIVILGIMLFTGTGSTADVQSVLEGLQQNIENIRMGFFDFVE